MSAPKTVRQALDDFKVAMIESNNRYIQEYLKRLLARTDIGPEEKDEEFVDFCGDQDAPVLPEPFPTCAEDIPAFVMRFEHEYPHFDGTLPPQPLEVRDAFFEKLQLEINKRANKTLWPADLLIPDDYKELLALTNGIYDPDFRGAKPAPFHGVLPGNLFDELIVPVKRLGEFCGWEIGGGWRAGLCPDGWGACCYMMFCRNIDAKAAEEEREWTWRIEYHASVDQIYGEEAEEPFVVNGIVEFLDLWARWYSRSNIEARLELAVGPSQ